MPLKICFKNIVKIVCYYNFSKKKKKMNGMELWQWHCQNRRKKKVLVCGNAIAEIGGKNFVAIVVMPLPQFHYTFFFRNDIYIYIYFFEK